MGEGLVGCRGREVDDEWSIKVVKAGEIVNGFLSQGESIESRRLKIDSKVFGRKLEKNGFVAGTEAHILLLSQQEPMDKACS